MSEKIPPPPPADAMIDDGIPMNRKENFSMIKGDLKEIVGLDDPRINLIAEYIHLIVENKDKPLDAKEIKLMRSLMRLILKNGGGDFVRTLSNVNNLVRECLVGPKVDATMGRKNEK